MVSILKAKNLCLEERILFLEDLTPFRREAEMKMTLPERYPFDGDTNMLYCHVCKGEKLLIHLAVTSIDNKALSKWVYS